MLEFFKKIKFIRLFKKWRLIMAWDNAPSHICRGGDVRGLAFCCPPVKPCPIMGALKEVGLTPQEFLDIKQKFASETRLGEGPATCFGSLVWCCKTSKPCPLRDMTLRNMGMSHDEYLDLKKEPSLELNRVYNRAYNKAYNKAYNRSWWSWFPKS